MAPPEPDDDQRNDALYSLATRRGIPAVATTNAHHATPERYQLAHATAAIRSTARPDPDEWLVAHLQQHICEVPPNNTDVSAPTPESSTRRANSLPNWLLTCRWLHHSCRTSRFLPGIPEASYLRLLAEQGAQRLYGPRSNERVPGAWKQIDHELKIIEQLNFPGYF